MINICGKFNLNQFIKERDIASN